MMGHAGQSPLLPCPAQDSSGTGKQHGGRGGQIGTTKTAVSFCCTEGRFPTLLPGWSPGARVAVQRQLGRCSCPEVTLGLGQELTVLNLERPTSHLMPEPLPWPPVNHPSNLPEPTALPDRGNHELIYPKEPYSISCNMEMPLCQFCQSPFSQRDQLGQHKSSVRQGMGCQIQHVDVKIQIHPRSDHLHTSPQHQPCTASALQSPHQHQHCWLAVHHLLPTTHSFLKQANIRFSPFTPYLFHSLRLDGAWSTWSSGGCPCPWHVGSHSPNSNHSVVI